jgi:LuxR family transcriptional regulator, maltose regulon positive regulatory protein
MLLRNSVCERVNGELADLLTGYSGSEAMLAELEQAGAFVVALDARRSWFRYHQLFADLLQRELRRTSLGELAVLHGAAARWYGGHGSPTEALRHAQAARDWDLAARLLFDHWLDLVLSGEGAAAHQLLTSFPAHVVAADAELTALMVVGELTRGSLEAAERHWPRRSVGWCRCPRTGAAGSASCSPFWDCGLPGSAVTSPPPGRKCSACLPVPRIWIWHDRDRARTCAR